MSNHLQEVADYVMGDDNSELARTKAELAYALMSLEREMGVCAQTHAAFLGYLQNENGCKRTGQPCREHQNCGCDLEAWEYINNPLIGAPK